MGEKRMMLQHTPRSMDATRAGVAMCLHTASKDVGGRAKQKRIMVISVHAVAEPSRTQERTCTVVIKPCAACVPSHIPEPTPSVGQMSGEDSEGEKDGKRLVKREAAVSHVKRTPSYIITVLYEMPRPTTPDPSGPCSKHTWERSVQRWRAALRTSLRHIHACDRLLSEDAWA